MLEKLVLLVDCCVDVVLLVLVLDWVGKGVSMGLGCG